MGKIILGLIVLFILIFDITVIFVAAIATLINIKTLKLMGSKYFFREYIIKELISIEIYRWIVFVKYMTKLLIVNIWGKYDSHKWLQMENLQPLKEYHRNIYINYLTKVRKKKHELEFW